MRSFIAVAALAAVSAAAVSDHWAVIMAGSNTYANYRHQADTHHAVQIMLKNGIPRDQIIHLAYDDVADYSWNPFPGNLYNKPDPNGPGVNVYDKNNIDYRGDDVNKSNFFKVLLGDDTASGPVLKSDSNSKVFVYFADHGANGLICTPQPSSDWIYADELNDTLQTMKTTGMFKELVFYVEACDSGSMFPDLTDTEGIYAMTASNATQPSSAAYCGEYATVNTRYVGSCLGDEFSVNWMEDSDAADMSTETLEDQYNTVKAKTSFSPVQKFGDFSLMSEPIGDFEGTDDSETKTWAERMVSKYTGFASKFAYVENKEKGANVSSRDVDLHLASERAYREGTQEAHDALLKEIEHRQFVDYLFSKHFDAEEPANAPETPQDFDCLRLMVGSIEDLCGPWSAYSLQYVRKLAVACDTKPQEELAQLIAKIGHFCYAF